jgi:hypothetical protein
MTYLEWNKKYKIGTPVLVGGYDDTETTSEAWCDEKGNGLIRIKSRKEPVSLHNIRGYIKVHARLLKSDKLLDIL